MDFYYDTIAPSYNELHGDEQLHKIKIIKNAITLPAGTLLDVGCGTGISTARWNSKEATGIDPSKGLITIAQQSYPQFTFLQGYAEKLPFKDKQFDVVVSLTAIQNFNSIEQGLSEIKRVGKKHFILTFLKGTPKQALIVSTITTLWPKHLFIDEKKDFIYII